MSTVIDEIMTTKDDEVLIGSLTNKIEAALYLKNALKQYQTNGDVEVFLVAMRHVAKAQGGVGELSKKTHLNRQSLYKTLSRKGNPRLQTVWVLLKGMGFEFTIQPA